jgi:hypothetical protein
MKDKNYLNYLGIQEGIESRNPEYDGLNDMDTHHSLQNKVVGWSSKDKRYPANVDDPLLNKIMDQISFKIKAKTKSDGSISEKENISPLDLLEDMEDSDDIESFLSELGMESNDKYGGEGKKTKDGTQITPAPKDDEKRESELKGSEGGEGMSESFNQFLEEDVYNSDSDRLLFEDIIKEEDDEDDDDDDEDDDDDDEDDDDDDEDEKSLSLDDSYEAKIMKNLITELKAIDKEIENEEDNHLLDENDYFDFSDYDELFETDTETDFEELL